MAHCPPLYSSRARMAHEIQLLTSKSGRADSIDWMTKEEKEKSSGKLCVCMCGHFLPMTGHGIRDMQGK